VLPGSHTAVSRPRASYCSVVVLLFASTNFVGSCRNWSSEVVTVPVPAVTLVVDSLVGRTPALGLV
jgi:hypothetical protein